MRVLAVVIVVLVLVVTGAGAEIVVSTHLHSNHSDGMGTMQEVVDIARQNGAQAAIISDHAEMVNLDYVYLDVYPWAWSVDKPRPRLLIQHKEPGVQSWTTRIQGSYPIPVVPGMEVGLGETRSSHLLYWGGDLSAYTEVVEISKTSNFFAEAALEGLALLALRSGAVLVQAHSLNESYPYTEKVIRAPGLTWGIEFFNGTVPQQVKCFERMVRLQAQMPDQHVIATGGTDFHWSYADVLTNLAHILEGIDLQRGNSFEPCMWRRTIAVRCPDVSTTSINAALREGRCYAAFDGGRSENRILSASAMPGESFQPTPQNRVFRMQIKGMEGGDEVVFGIAGRDGGAKIYTLSGERHVENGVGTIAVDLDQICPREVNCGWWLFVMTPEVVTSAIEILAWPEERVVTQPPLTIPEDLPRIPPGPPTTRPPVTTTRPTTPTPVSQDPMALIAGYPRKYYGEGREGPFTNFYGKVLGEGGSIRAWAGFDRAWNGRLIVCCGGVWRDVAVQLPGDHITFAVDPHSFGQFEMNTWGYVWRSVELWRWTGHSVDSTGTLNLLKLTIYGDFNNGFQWSDSGRAPLHSLVLNLVR